MADMAVADPTSPPSEASVPSERSSPAASVVALATRAPADNPTPPIAALKGRRVSIDASSSVYGKLKVIEPPKDYESTWRQLQLDSKTLDKLTPSQLLDILPELSPDVSRALWDFIRMCNPGNTITAHLPGEEQIHKKTQKAVDTFLERLTDYYGSPDVVWARLFMGAFLRGAFFSELVLDEDGREPIDLATPDPSTVRFQRDVDPIRGTIWRLGQWQQQEFVLLDRLTIRYLPVDPAPGSPYGRPIIAPALFSALFAMTLLHDLRRVISQQGYTRLDISVDLERVAAGCPFDYKADPRKWKAYVDDIIREVADAYEGLQPDDAMVHTNLVTVNRPVGAVDTQSIGGIGQVFQVLERFSMRALKSMPLLMGTTEGQSEANANRQWEIHAAGIRAFQKYAAAMISRQLSLAMRAMGLPGVVNAKFLELRQSERMRDAQTEAIIIDNESKKYANGWQSQDDASLHATDHKADVPEPRFQTTAHANETGANPPAPAEPEPGAQR